MNKILLTISLLVAIKCSALTIIPISLFPNIISPATNYTFLWARAGVTNYNMTATQLELWLANDSVFINALLSNTNLHFNSSATNFTAQTFSPNVVWTNVVAYWITNANFTIATTYTPGPVFYAELVVSNSSANVITSTLPNTMYSISLGTNATRAIVPAGSVLDLQFSYYNGTYFVKDYGKNNSVLAQIASTNGNGFLYLSNGLIYIK